MPPRARRTSTRAKAQPAPEPEDIEDDIDDLEDEVEEEPAPVKKAPARRTRKAAAKPAPEPEPEEDEEEDEDVAEADDDDELEDEEEAAPVKAKRQPSKRKDIQYGTKWLAEYVNEKLGVDVTPYKLRDLIRKMVKDNKFDRNIGVDRDRYEFTGSKDAKVIAVLKEIKGGALERKSTGNADNLAKARAKRAENLAAKKKAAPVEDVEELEDEDDIEELDD
jgi:hypothetical protein